MALISIGLFMIMFVIIIREEFDALPGKAGSIYSFTNRNFFLFFLAYIIIWYTQLSYRMEERFGGIRLEAIVGAILLILAFTRYSKETKAKSPGLTLYLVALSMAAAIQVPLSIVPELSQNLFIDNYLKYLAMSLFIITFVKNPWHLLIFILIWMLAYWKVTMEGVIGGVTGSLVWQNQGVMRLHGSVPRYTHPNSLSQVALNVLPYVYFLYPLIKSKWIKIFFLTSVLQSLYCIMYSGSRTAYLGVMGLLFFVWWRSDRKVKIRSGVIIIVVGAICFVSMPLQYKERLTSSFTGDKEGHSSDKRKAMYREGLSILMDNPFGLGLGGYIFEVARRTNDPGNAQEVHCLYLEVATHMGIQGFIVFMALIVKLLQIAKRNIGDINKQVVLLKKILAVNVQENNTEYFVIKRRINELDIIKAVINATLVFLFVRLIVGILGMDFYNIHWWFTVGVFWTCSNMVQRAGLATNDLIEKSNYKM